MPSRGCPRRSVAQCRRCEWLRTGQHGAATSLLLAAPGGKWTRRRARPWGHRCMTCDGRVRSLGVHWVDPGEFGARIIPTLHPRRFAMGSPSDMPPDRNGPLIPPDSAAIGSQSEPPPAKDHYAPLRLSNRATTRPPPVPARQSPPLRDVARTAHFLSPTRPPRKRVGQHDLCAS